MKLTGGLLRHISLDEAVEMIEARAVLEGLAARYAAQNATPPDIAELEAIVKAMEDSFAAGDLPAISDLNVKLHATLQVIANHKTVTQLLGRLQASHVRYRTGLSCG